MAIAPETFARLRAHPFPGLQEWRCQRCGRMLARFAVAAGAGHLEIKCHSCNQLNLLTLRPADCAPAGTVLE